MPEIKIKIDAGVCIAAAACVATEPDVFTLDEDNIAAILGPDGSSQYERTLEVSEARKRKILEAAQACPTGAITVSE